MNDERGDEGVAQDFINLDDHDHVLQWTEILDVTADELAAAVHAVGPARADVKRYVRARKD